MVNIHQSDQFNYYIYLKNKIMFLASHFNNAEFRRDEAVSCINYGGHTSGDLTIKGTARKCSLRVKPENFGLKYNFKNH